MSEDQEILRQREMSRLFKLYARPVYGVCLNYVRDRQIAQDLRQEVFVKALRHYECFRGESAPMTWLYRITVNCCLDYLRRKKRHHDGMVLAEQNGFPGADLFSANGLETEKEMREEVANFMAGLPLTTRYIARLHYGEGFPLEQVGAKLGIPYLEVRRHLARFHRRARIRRERIDNFESCGFHSSSSRVSCGRRPRSGVLGRRHIPFAGRWLQEEVFG